MCGIAVVVGLCLLADLASAETDGQTTTEPGGQAAEVRDLASDLFAPEAEVRYAAVAAVAALGDPAWIEPLALVAANDPEPTIRGWALRALRRIDTPQALRRILAVQRSDSDSRVAGLAGQLLAGTDLEPVLAPVRHVSRPRRPPDREARPRALARTQLDVEEARTVRRLTTAAFSLAGTGLALTVAGAIMTFGDTSGTTVDAGIAFQVLGGVAWIIDTPLIFSASRRMETLTGRSGSQRRLNVGLYVAGLALSVVHAATGFLSEAMAITMPIVNGLVCTTARIMSLVLGARANREARSYLAPR